MRRSTIAAALIAITGAGLLMPAATQAQSVGFYGTVGAGEADWESSRDRRFDDRRDTRHGGAGVVFDTSAPYHPLGYRLAIGWERIVNEAAFESPGFTMKGVVVDQDLMVNLLRGGWPLRLWIGPELRIGWFKGATDGAPGPDEHYLAVGVGPAFGVDVAVAPGLALSWKLGYLATGYASNDRSSFNGRDDTSLGEGHAYATLAVMFRTWGGPRELPPDDRYDRRPPRW